MRALVIPILLWIAVLPAIASGIEVSGDVWGTWSPENNPYEVVGQLRVPPESTLAIEPGVFVNFQGHYKFVVDSLATFLAIGTETDSIYFTTDDTATGWHGIRLFYADTNSQISYCHLEYGKAIGDQWQRDANGGAIYCEYSSPTISNNCIIGNLAYWAGGGVYCNYSNPAITGNTICTNSARQGGGIYCRYSDPAITHNRISTNLAEERGGGIRCRAFSNPTINENTIEGNWAFSDGGGISCATSSPIITGNMIRDNSVNSDGWGGGAGICCYEMSRPQISKNVIINNSATGRYDCGGGIGCADYGAYIYNNVISGNQASGVGGGIYSCMHYHDPPNIANNTITGNTADCGGGISCYYSTPTITNCIFWGNTAGWYPEIYVEAGGYPIVTYCDVQGSWTGEGNIDIDPLFRDPQAWDFHLMADYCGDPYNSPCIDAGHPDSLDILLDCFHGLGTDRCDMGAYGGRNSGWPTGIDDDDSNPTIPRQFLLHQNYPNPFNATTVIRYQLTTPTYVKLEIYNLFGQRLATLVDFRQQGGNRSVIWDASRFSSGVYFYRLTAGECTFTRKMVLSK